MAEVSIDLNMVRVTNDIFVNKAEACVPELLKTVVRPVAIVDIVKTEDIYPKVQKADDIENLCLSYGKRRQDLSGLRRSSGRLCYPEAELRRKSAGFTGIFQTEIR